MIRVMLVVLIAAASTACSTPMKLDRVSVEDRTPGVELGCEGVLGASQQGQCSAVALVSAVPVKLDVATN